MGDTNNTIGLNDDAFDLAFAELTGEPLLEETPKEELPPVEDPPKEEPKEELPPVEDPPKEEPKEELPPVEDPPKEEPPKKRGRPKKEVPPPPEPSAEELKAAADAEAKRIADAQAAEEFTAEEQELREVVAKDFPEVDKLLQAVQRTTMAKAENKFNARLSALEKQLEERLAPISNIATHVAQTEHEKAILAEHADAFELLPEVETWIESKPEFMQKEVNRILDAGTSAEVVSLLSFYKTEKAGRAQPPDPKKEVEDAERQKKLDAQEGVKSRSSVARAAIDPNDFDGAFEKFAEERK